MLFRIKEGLSSYYHDKTKGCLIDAINATSAIFYNFCEWCKNKAEKHSGFILKKYAR